MEASREMRHFELRVEVSHSCFYGTGGLYQSPGKIAYPSYEGYAGDEIIVERHVEKELTMEALMKRILCSLLVAASIVIGCKAAGEPSSLAEAQQARAELEKRNVPYTPDVFVQKAGQGEVEAVELFLRARMAPNSTNKYGSTALIWACGQGREAVARMLLAGGAELAAEARDGSSALTAAASEGQIKIADLLLTHGAKMNARTRSGMLPLIAAVRENRSEMVEFLLSKGGDLEARDPDRRTALFYAAYNF